MTTSQTATSPTIRSPPDLYKVNDQTLNPPLVPCGPDKLSEELTMPFIEWEDTTVNLLGLISYGPRGKSLQHLVYEISHFSKDFWFRQTRFLIYYRDCQRFLRSDLPLDMGHGTSSSDWTDRQRTLKSLKLLELKHSPRLVGLYGTQTVFIIITCIVFLWLVLWCST